MAHIEAYAALGGDEKLFVLTESPTYYFTQGWEVLDTADLDGQHVFVMQKNLSEQN